MNNYAVNIRELVVEILLSIDKGEEQSHILIKNVLDKYDYLPQADKNFIKRTVTGTLEWRVRIDYIINQFSKTPVNKMKPLIRNLMRMSVYQIIYMDKVPDSAVCNEAVKLAGKRGFKGLQGFVNGVLRSISRGKDDIKLPDSTSTSAMTASDIEVLYSCPKLIVESLISDYGVEQTVEVLKASLTDRGISVRLDEGLTASQVKEIIDDWQENGILYEKSDELSYAYRLKKADKLFKLDCFINGCCTVQDFSSMNVCEMADIKAGDLILDMCAAPGGKSLHAANKLSLAQNNIQIDAMDSKMGKIGRVISRDLTEYKVSIIDENIARVGADNITAECHDATVFDTNLENKVDIVILDVPCSGFGVIGGKPDIKYNISSEGLSSIVELQRKIIDNAVRYVRSGGSLMYSTCTMRKAENDENVDYILAGGDYELIEKKQYFITDKWDGFFIARLKKR